jgi:iron(II)-dependent oxidoreductase
MDAVRATLAERLQDTRARTLALFAPLPHEHLVRPPSPLLSPPLWDLGHIGAYEELWLARRVAGRPPLHPELDEAYDAFETPRATRGDVRILSEREARDYLDRVRGRSLEALARADLAPDGPPLTAGGFVFEMVAEHEAQHAETVLQALQMLPAGAYLPAGRRPPPPGEGPSGDWVEIPGGAFAMGAPEEGFAYDCERPRHAREVAPFLMARDPVSAGEHLEFMRDGGYRRPELWSERGRRWLAAEGAEAPLYWERDGEGGWLVRSFERREPVDPELPVCHLSAHEADAHARWAGARLPREEEWERAAAGARADPAAANLGTRAFGPAPIGAYPAAPSGCRGMMGDVWEWTATALEGYPGFRAHPYREYAEVFFGRGYRVLRGGSWATQPIAARVSFRNWDLPERRQIFSGLRLARGLP